MQNPNSLEKNTLGHLNQHTTLRTVPKYSLDILLSVRNNGIYLVLGRPPRDSVVAFLQIAAEPHICPDQRLDSEVLDVRG